MKNVMQAELSRLLISLWLQFTPKRRSQFVVLLVLMVASAFAEVVSLGSVLPFLGVLIAPDRLLNNSALSSLVIALDINSSEALLFPLTGIFIFAALIAAAFRMLLLWYGTRLAVVSGADLSIEVYRHTLYQPYEVHVARNSSTVISGLTNKINSVIFGVILPLITLASSALLLISILLTLIFIDPWVALVTASGFGISYLAISSAFRRRVDLNSRRIAREQIQVVKALQEGLGGIRDVLLDGMQSLYCDIYRKADYPLRLSQGENVFIGGAPRYIMEALGMVLIAVLAYFLSQQSGGVVSALPLLGALALGAQRLLPALQQAYSAWVSIVGNYASLAEVVQFLDDPIPNESLQTPQVPIIFRQSIRLDNIFFQYESKSGWVLDGLNLYIPKGARIGIIGSTGSGKSTMLDLIMGLHLPNAGMLLVDDQPITGANMRSWQKIIAHVPQSIYLADATLAENIAFGVTANEIDLGRVKEAARQAQIADFIETSPEGYQAYVGERGIRLSGGQRQRIGIARALYKRASVLVFDEATSALDNATEQFVMEAIESLGKDLTILTIAHRLTTIKKCDMIVELEHGKVVSQGTYEQLLETSPSFSQLVSVANK